jgi:hypothetical protein
VVDEQQRSGRPAAVRLAARRGLELGGGAEVERRLLHHRRLVVDPRGAARPVLGEHEDALVAVDHVPQRRPRARGAAAVDLVDEAARADHPRCVGRARVVLDRQHEHLLGVADEEPVHLPEGVERPRRADFAQRVAEEDVALARPGVADAPADALRRRHEALADLGHELRPRGVLARQVGPHSTRPADPVVGVDEQGVDALAQLRGDPGVLRREQPPGLAGR